METAEIIAVSVAVLLIAIEILCLYICSRLKCKYYPLCIIIPVHRMDSSFTARLDCIGSLIEEGDPLVGTVLLMDIGSDETQLKQCGEFCRKYHAAELILPGDIEKTMKNYLHFESNYDII